MERSPTISNVVQGWRPVQVWQTRLPLAIGRCPLLPLPTGHCPLATSWQSLAKRKRDMMRKEIALAHAVLRWIFTEKSVSHCMRKISVNLQNNMLAFESGGGMQRSARLFLRTSTGEFFLPSLHNKSFNKTNRNTNIPSSSNSEKAFSLQVF